MRALSNVLAILLRGQDVFPAPQARAIRVFRDSSKRLLDGHKGEARSDRGAPLVQSGSFVPVPDCRAKRSVERRFDTFTSKEVHSEGLDHKRPPLRAARRTPSFQKRGLQSGGRESNSSGGTVARRPNYGFEKKQRELRKKKKNEEKAERRSREEAASSAPASGEAEDEDEDENPPESGPRDRG